MNPDIIERLKAERKKYGQAWTLVRRSTEPGHEWFMLSFETPVKSTAEADEVLTAFLALLDEAAEEIKRLRAEREELARLYDGRSVVLPKSEAHAKSMIQVAGFFLRETPQ